MEHYFVDRNCKRMTGSTPYRRDCFYCDLQKQLDSNPMAVSQPGHDTFSRPITAPQRAEIEDLVALLQKSVHGIDQAIAILQQKRQELHITQERYQNLLQICPLMAMAPEILVNIFRHCVTYNKNGIPVRPAARYRILAQVCQYWRDTVLGTPQLWCDIDVMEYTNSPSRLAHELALSKDLPLHIFINEAGRILDSKPHLFYMLLQTRHRWVSFTSLATLSSFFSFLEQPGNSPKFPLLQSLSGSLYPHNQLEAKRGLNAIDAPALIHINLDLSLWSPDKGAPRFPWSQIHHIHLSSFPPSCAISILLQSSSLHRLYLNVTSRKDDHNPYLKQPITLPRLTTLGLDATPRSLFTFGNPVGMKQEMQFISFLRLPALKALFCTKLSDDGVEVLAEMLRNTAFPSTPQQGVQTLELDSPVRISSPPERTPLYLTPLFTQLPNLKTLHLKHLGDAPSEQLFELLASRPMDIVLCPVMERLSIVDAVLEPRGLEQFILSRLEHAKSTHETGLTHLELEHACRLDSYDPNGVKALTKALDAFTQRPGACARVDIKVTEYTQSLMQCFGGSQSTTLTPTSSHSAIHPLLSKTNERHRLTQVKPVEEHQSQSRQNPSSTAFSFS